jgi:probable phosphoglycerate mutase
MTILMLIRHGETDYIKQGKLAGRLPGIHLNEKGRQQARQLADQLASAPIRAVYSSPMERTIETAEPIAGALKREIVISQELTEIDVGEWQDCSLKQLKKLRMWKTVQTTPGQAQFPGGEPFIQAQSRICNELLRISRQHNPKDVVLCVSHADPIRLAVALFIGLPIDMFQRLIVSPASITTLEIRDSSSRLLTLNYTLHPGF